MCVSRAGVLLCRAAGKGKLGHHDAGKHNQTAEPADRRHQTEIGVADDQAVENGFHQRAEHRFGGQENSGDSRIGAALADHLTGVGNADGQKPAVQNGKFRLRNLLQQARNALNLEESGENHTQRTAKRKLNGGEFDGADVAGKAVDEQNVQRPEHRADQGQNGADRLIPSGYRVRRIAARQTQKRQADNGQTGAEPDIDTALFLQKNLLLSFTFLASLE